MYEVEQTTVTSVLKASNTAVFTDDTIAKILALSTQDNATVSFETAIPDANGVTTVAAGAEVVLVQSSDTTTTSLMPPKNAPVVIFQGLGGVNTTFNDGQAAPHAFGVADRVVVGSAGNDRIVVADAKNTSITLGTGDSTVTTGTGWDTVVTGLGNSTIVGGSSHSIVQMRGNASDYTVTVQNGHAIVTHNGGDGTHTDISKLQFVQLDNKDALIFAKDELQAAVTSLYHTAFGRTADASGLQFWFDRAAEGISLKDIANAFTKPGEFNSQATLSDAAFVTMLYSNAFNRTPDTDGLAYWTNALSHGTTRGDVIAAFADAAGQSLESGTGEITTVGHITIVHNIV
jgi:hypothetical protein